MSLLLLDPLVLLLYGCVVIYGWLVWSGRFRSWFRADRLWLGCWPLPAVVAAVPLLVGPLLGAVDGLGSGDEAGGLIAVSAYVVLNGVPMAWLGLAPPRWLLPPWARRRLTPLPGPEHRPTPGAVAAVHAARSDARTTWPRWRWRVDGEPGHVWVEAGQLRFRAYGSTDEATAAGIDDFVQDEIDQLELRWGTEARLEAPRGGWWRRRWLDVDLDALDDWRLSATRPWTSDGLATLAVEGRAPLRLWVTDIGRVRRAIETELSGRRPA